MGRPRKTDAIRIAELQADAQLRKDVLNLLSRPEVLGPLSVVGTILITSKLRESGLLTKDQAGIACGAGVAIAVGVAVGGTAGILAGLGAGGLSAASVGQEWPTVAGIAGGAATGAAIGSVVPGVGTLLGAGIGAGAGGLIGALTD